jgi:hypothetical protein
LELEMSRSPAKPGKKNGPLIPGEELKALAAREPWLAPVCQRLGELTEAGFGRSLLAYQMAEYIKAAIRAC